MNGPNPAVVDELIAPDHAHHRALGPDQVGREARRASLLAWHDAFAGFRVVIDDVIREGEMVVVRGTNSGRHQGEFLGFAPTGQDMESTVVFIFRIECGQIAETWVEGSVHEELYRRAETPGGAGTPAS